MKIRNAENSLIKELSHALPFKSNCVRIIFFALVLPSTRFAPMKFLVSFPFVLLLGIVYTYALSIVFFYAVRF